MTYYSAKYVLFNFIHFQIFERSFHKGEMVTVLQGYVLWMIRDPNLGLHQCWRRIVLVTTLRCWTPLFKKSHPDKHSVISI